MLLLRDEEHTANWCAQWGRERGGVLTLDQAWRLAQAWYGQDRRDPGWRRKTVDEAEEVFSSLGMTAPFWSLRD